MPPNGSVSYSKQPQSPILDYGPQNPALDPPLLMYKRELHVPLLNSDLTNATGGVTL